MENSEFKQTINLKAENINNMLEGFLPEEKGWQKTILEAMNYSVRVGGKRLRPMLMWETFLLCGGKEEKKAAVEPFMAAIEMIHTYSLVHDDLPAMDNDVLRRGNPTTWSRYGETMGILAGDGLLNYAFETAAKAFETAETLEDYKRAAQAITILGKRAGVYGMVGGQTVDVEAEGSHTVLTEEQLIFIHENKTAALIQAAMTIGACLAGADEKQLEAIDRAAYNIGIAFQIQDDILDVIGDVKELGKTIGKDAQSEKMTYVRLKGLEESGKEVETLSEEAIAILDSFEQPHEFLTELITWLIHRKN